MWGNIHPIAYIALMASSILRTFFKIFAVIAIVHSVWKILGRLNYSPLPDLECSHKLEPSSEHFETPPPHDFSSTYAYTVLCTNLKTVFPALVLFHQLEVVGSRADRVIMLPENLASRVGPLFKAMGSKVFRYEASDNFPCPNYPVSSRSTRKRDQSLWSKLLAWKLTNYEKVICLDSDLLVLSNIDELFVLNTDFAGVPSLYADEKILFWDPPEPLEADPLLPRSWANLTKFSSQEDFHSGLNSGVLLIRPNATLFDELIVASAALESRTCCPTQEFLFRFFELRGQYHRLSPIYNMRKYHKLTKEEQAAWSDIKIYHFVERKKPWHLGRKESSAFAFEKDWWSRADSADERIIMVIQQLIPDLLSLYREAKHAAISNLDKN